MLLISFTQNVCVCVCGRGRGGWTRAKGTQAPTMCYAHSLGAEDNQWIKQSSSLHGVYIPTGEVDSQLHTHTHTHTHTRRLVSDKEEQRMAGDAESPSRTLRQDLVSITSWQKEPWAHQEGSPATGRPQSCRREPGDPNLPLLPPYPISWQSLCQLEPIRGPRAKKP